MKPIPHHLALDPPQSPPSPLSVHQRSRRTTLRLAAGLALAPLVWSLPLPAFATLGGGASSPSSDRVRMKAAASAVGAGQGYTMESLQTDSGTTVREYVSTGGTVFLVTWDGPRMPDLQQIFGDYYQQYLDHLKERRANGVRGAQVVLRSDGLVVESRGRVGEFSGRAWVPALVPAQVDLGTLQ